MGILVKNAEIITAQRRWLGDIRCRQGRIVELGQGLGPGVGEESLDAGDLLVFPGGVDPHVHMQLPVAGNGLSGRFREWQRGGPWPEARPPSSTLSIRSAARTSSRP